MQSVFKVIGVFCVITCVLSSIQLYRVKLTQTTTSYTLSFATAFSSTPNFAFYIETATFNGSQFSITYDNSLTLVTQSSINITFIVLRQSSFQSTEIFNIALLVTDQNPLQFSVGLVQTNLNNLTTISIPNITINRNSKLQVYSLTYPLVWTKTSDSTHVYLNVSKYSTKYAYNASFAYIYYTNTFVGERVMALFQDITENIYEYFIPYQNFAYTPYPGNVMLALKQYDNSGIPFMNSQITIVYNGVTGSLNQLQVGFSFANGAPTIFRTDVLVFNQSYSACPQGNYLYYPILFSTLPFKCIPCNSLCKTCAPSNSSNPSITDSNNCLSCFDLRYLNTSGNVNGSCPCYIGLKQINNTCQPCKQNCLRFKVTYVQSTTQSTFLLFYSFGQVNQILPIQNNLLVFVNGESVGYTANSQQSSVYTISIDLSIMNNCSAIGCHVMFYYQFPNQVLTVDGSQSLSNNNVTVTVSGIPDYYSLLPGQLKQGFQILGLITAGSYMGGYSSLFKLLFELQQLIDCHKYLNLTMPIIFNQLLDSLFYFRFLDITNLMPWSMQVQIKNVVPSDLDVYGQPRFMYYQNGVNFYKNTINAIITCLGMLTVNLLIFIILRTIPLNFTRSLAEKINSRKIITIHDTLQNLVLPIVIFAIGQLQIILLHPYLIWIYGMSLILSSLALGAPFLVVIYIYHHRHLKDRINIYEDLMQDNAMSLSVTYFYYIFNFYRKVVIALALCSWLPGVVQIYIMIVFNVLHLFFQIYLIAMRAFNSKIKIIIRFIYSLCVITLQLLILIYNVNSNNANTMINIGMACLHMSLTTTLLGMADVCIKLIELLCDQVKNRMKISTELQLSQQIPKQFALDIICKIGKLGHDLANDRPSSQPSNNAAYDKEMGQVNVRPKDETSSDCVTIKIADISKYCVQQADLVPIDDEEWEDIYPPAKGKSVWPPKQKPIEDKNPLNPSEYLGANQLFYISPEMQRQLMEIEANKNPQQQTNQLLKQNDSRVVVVDLTKNQQKSQQKQFEIRQSRRREILNKKKNNSAQPKKQNKQQNALLIKDTKSIIKEQLGEQIFS